MSHSLCALRAVVGLSLCTATAQAQGTQPPTKLPSATVVGEAGKRVAVQNDRNTAVTLYLDAGRVDRAIGTVAAGATSSLTLPDWALRGQQTVRLVARADGNATAVASYAVPVSDKQVIGLLVPPAGGLPSSDSMVVSLPPGSADVATLTVENKRDRAVTMFAEQGLMFVRIGEVEAKQQETLRVPESMTRSKDPIRIFVRSAGATALSTKGMRVERGARFAVVVM